MTHDSPNQGGPYGLGSLNFCRCLPRSITDNEVRFVFGPLLTFSLLNLSISRLLPQSLCSVGPYGWCRHRVSLRSLCSDQETGPDRRR